MTTRARRAPLLPGESRWWHESVDSTSVAVLRIALGLAIPLELLHYRFRTPYLEQFYLLPEFHFKYPGFAWVPDLPSAAAPIFLVLLATSFVLLGLGLFYATARWFCFLGFSFLFLTERAGFLNHWYLVCLLTFLLLWIPAHRTLSLDRLRGALSNEPSTIPRWCLALPTAMVGLVYLFAGLVKIDEDWLLAAQPMKIYCADMVERGPRLLATVFGAPATPWVMSYGAVAFEVLVVPGLLWRRTRIATFSSVLLFHGLNEVLFAVGMFPALMVACTTLFFDPSWPRKLLPSRKNTRGEVLPPVDPARRPTPLGLATLSLFFALQVALPARAWFFSGDPLWSEAGLLFSWRMMMEAKTGATPETLSFLLVDPVTGVSRTVDPVHTDLGPRLTWGQANKLVRNPDLVVQYAHALREAATRQGIESPRVYADVFVGVNGRTPRRLVHPHVDLAREARPTFGRPWFVLPLRD